MSPTPLKIMIVGDSITHGEEGDYTWRYRVWEWFKNCVPEVDIKLVGPSIGTVPPQIPQAPQPPRLPWEKEPEDRDMTTGGYAKAASKDFDKYHFSHTGMQVAQAKDRIKGYVETYQPDMLLVMLGFNDMAWCVAGDEDTLENTHTFIENARAAKPDIQFAIGNVLQRTHIHGDGLAKMTAKYNSKLHDALPEWSKKSSRIEHVEIERNYGFTPDECKGTHDGLHPNELGDFQIAKAFTETLHRAYGYGSRPVKVPAHIPERPLPVPSNIKVHGVSYGVQCSFDAVYGSRGYDVRQRMKGQDDWNEMHVGPNQVDNTFTGDDTEWEYQVRSTGGIGQKGQWSETARGQARRETAPAPPNAKVYATPKGFEVSWDELQGWDVDRYCVLYMDKTEPGFLCGKAASGTSAEVDDLPKDHRFEVWVQTWTNKGPGVPAGIGMIVVGSGVFSRPASAS
ncbi:hypothetical protein PRZ48_013447 [Zasmidium cellare]|uniref:Fibronectin type-III domain-containing protein n=1 Tax=Zasmidium cellare TaxID=395010 RepID=A0ABR0E130_ZASCE|nr:hypothetical protein PRZ48_013447 [Zasmidium cellare]